MIVPFSGVHKSEDNSPFLPGRNKDGIDVTLLTNYNRFFLLTLFVQIPIPSSISLSGTRKNLNLISDANVRI